MPTRHGTFKAGSMSPQRLEGMLGYHQAEGILPGLLFAAACGPLGVGCKSKLSSLLHLCSAEGPVCCCPAYQNPRIKASDTCGHRKCSQSMGKPRPLLATLTHFVSSSSALEMAPKSLKGHPITKFTGMSLAVRNKS